MKKNGFVWFLLIMMVLVVALFVYNLKYVEQKRTKDYKTAKEWALEAVKEDFFYTRESDEAYLYTIEEFHIGNFEHEDDYYGKYIRAFKVVMMADFGESETYLFVITYNLDNHFNANFKRFFGFVKEERFGEEHIVWADVD